MRLDRDIRMMVTQIVWLAMFFANPDPEASNVIIVSDTIRIHVMKAKLDWFLGTRLIVIIIKSGSYQITRNYWKLEFISSGINEQQQLCQILLMSGPPNPSFTQSRSVTYQEGFITRRLVALWLLYFLSLSRSCVLPSDDEIFVLVLGVIMRFKKWQRNLCFSISRLVSTRQLRAWWWWLDTMLHQGRLTILVPVLS